MKKTGSLVVIRVNSCEQQSNALEMLREIRFENKKN